MAFKTMDDVDFNGKKVLVRADLDSPFDGQIMDNQRLLESAKTIAELSDKRAAVVVMGHQGRPGKKSFTRLAQHAAILTKHVGKTVIYIDSIHDSAAISAIKVLHPGDILLLENVRFSAEEMLEQEVEKFSDAHFVTELEPLFDYYVQNAFTNAHRAHASMVGFGKLPQISGRRFATEVEGIRQAAHHVKRPYVMVLGGAKIFDYLSLIDKVFAEDTVDKILVGGLFADLCLLAKGHVLGKKETFLKQTDSLAKKSLLDILPDIKRYLEEHADKFEIPTDVAIEKDGERVEINVDALPVDYMIYDIGRKTAEHYAEIILGAKTIYMKGPVGMYEDDRFSLGSEIVVKAIGASDGYSLVGGGDSVEVVERFTALSNISHVGLAGGATLKLLAGKSLPAIEMLERE